MCKGFLQQLGHEEHC